jgi:predicted RNase H-like HicB family nuclease
VSDVPRYLVIIEAGPTSYSAYVPDLPGCIVAAETCDEVEALIREGIALYIATLHERGDPHSGADHPRA